MRIFLELFSKSFVHFFAVLYKTTKRNSHILHIPEIVNYDSQLGNIVAETLLLREMFPSLAARESYVAETNFAARKHTHKKMFSPEVKNIFVSRKQLLRPQHLFPSLATIMLICFQCCQLIKKCFLTTMGGLQSQFCPDTCIGSPLRFTSQRQFLCGSFFLIPSSSSSKQYHTQSN